MSDKKSFWKANDEDVESVQSFLTSPVGLIISSVFGVAIVGAFFWSIIGGLFS